MTMQGPTSVLHRECFPGANPSVVPRCAVGFRRLLVLAGLALVFLPGCMAPRRLAIIDARTYEMKSFPPGGDTWYTSWLPTGRQSDSVLYIVQTGPQLEIVKRDLAGHVVSRRAIPFFDPFMSYLHALSPEENGFAYYRGKSDELWLYDLRTGEDRLLLRNVRLSSFKSRLFWISDRELAAIEVKSSPSGREEAEILKIDVASGSVSGRLAVVAGGDVAFFPPRNLLALAPVAPGEAVRIIDLKKLRLVDSISNSTPYSVSNLAWNPDGSRLAFRGGDKCLSEYSLQQRTVRRLVQIPENEICYFVGYVNREICACQSDDPERRKSAHLDFIEVATGRVVKSLRAPFNGRTGVIADGAKVVSWTGYR
jgi:hypothetical protein